MRIGVIDDERPARSELIYLLRQADETLEILEADSSEKLLELLEGTALDVCFVDINLNGMNGTTLASMIKSRRPETRIIFATAYQEYAVKAFELGAVDYLLKPFDLERVKKALERVNASRLPKVSGAEGQQVRTGDSLHKLMVQGKGSLQILDVSNIIYIETEHRTCKIYTVKECFVQNESLNYYENRLRDQNFFRIHKSFLVNLAYVRELVPSYNSGYSLVMKHYEKNPLPVGRQQVRALRQRFE